MHLIWVYRGATEDELSLNTSKRSTPSIVFFRVLYVNVWPGRTEEPSNTSNQQPTSLYHFYTSRQNVLYSYSPFLKKTVRRSEPFFCLLRPSEKAPDVSGVYFFSVKIFTIYLPGDHDRAHECTPPPPPFSDVL